MMKRLFAAITRPIAQRLSTAEGEDPRSMWTAVGDIDVHAYVAVGSGGPPIVLVHGLGVSSRYMLPTMRLLEDRYSVFAPDLPGFGRSEKLGRPLSIPEQMEVLSGWMERVGIARAPLLANSLGCQVIAELAVRRPDQVQALIMTGPTVDPHARSVHALLLRGIKDFPFERPSLWPILIRDYLRAGPLRTLGSLILALGHHIEHRLPAISVPVLVVRGEHDPVAPDRWIEEMVRLLPNGQAAVVAGAGHAPNFSASKQLARITSRFLADVLPEAAQPAGDARAREV